MGTQTHSDSRLSERDKLERLQEQLREVRARSAALRREKAELLIRTSTLVEEMRGLRRAQGITQIELERPPPSLPDPLILPFHVSPALRTGYGRLRTALKLLPASVVLCAHMAFGLIVRPDLFFPGLGAMVATLFVVLLLNPAPEDADTFSHWSFDEEGFFPADKGPSGGKVLYREIRQVQASQGPFQRLSGLGTVSVTWTPAAPTSLGSTAGSPQRVVKLKLIETPERLATWLRTRAPEVQGGSDGAAHGD